nr:PREDICTED: uncharacterized protein LOC107399024 [Tribolium castaneum]|eukprot:XP_015840154.1 PREDICTED: uncharacterized protein LOC107399024 [Tribolium castaneum]
MLLWLGRSRPVRLGCISYKPSKTNFSVKHSTPRGLFATTNCTERRRCRRWRNSSVRPPSEPFRRRKPTRTPWSERPLTTTKTVRPDARGQGWLSCDRKCLLTQIFRICSFQIPSNGSLRGNPRSAFFFCSGAMQTGMAAQRAFRDEGLMVCVNAFPLSKKKIKIRTAQAEDLGKFRTPHYKTNVNRAQQRKLTGKW